MKRSFKSILFSLLIFSTAYAGDKFNNLTEDYLTNSASLNVRTVIAKDPKTSSKVLRLLTHDSNKQVRQYAKNNLK
ncbi:hypothetical protein [Poseidonibacter ostreae]|jgi:hypothetical protein|uniref:HEAT repeat domain-containing protein n=1 Tax=Poseidonibacter ostreae TaxID=2654171 RepID=A0A6L4WRP5_9BACT|nr:hypothetical protein [Poseidonibacter ostreae]KAB7887552.1 hypothetical protein GA417_02605 [Poseidonibacter ostreae]KAB7888389.1 hypothetical protein GBG19_09125 [Poseidonibacter ostreae]KAB7888670.1 hypothetical protein GBG18_12560 [Poseidonibacter ostreae]MAC84500.1 hypothetical protein [Arcobacter sp.]|tara:strand:- start:18918 stop:19145 length:228 start_codon:yes stop_codon:yes gene_type:complete